MKTETVSSAPPRPQAQPVAEAASSTELRPSRRRFTSAYKQRILAEAEACKQGELGLLLRREGLYASLLAT